MNEGMLVCSVCSAPADGMHYGAISCRSCNAFFRRSIVEHVSYICKFYGTCLIDKEGRCSCRSCRFSKCLAVGMKPTSVQPRRDPTGSQRKRERTFSSSHMEQDDWFSEIMALREKHYMSNIPKEPVSFSLLKKLFEKNLYHQDNNSHTEHSFDFLCLVQFYSQHLRMMQLSFSTISSFPEQMQSITKLREATPSDMENLRKAELGGVFTWLDHINAYKSLPIQDQESLLERYSIRKVNLDRFYIASLYTNELQKHNFVLNNNTFIPPTRTGFEVVGEDEKQMRFKQQTFAETSSRSWKNVVLRFKELSIKDAEVAYLQLMLIWSVANCTYVSSFAKNLMKDQRNEAMRSLFEYYHLSKTSAPEIRFADITMMLGELEEICDMQCLDIQIFKIFGHSDLGNKWYIDACNSHVNNPRLEWDVNMIENLKKLNFQHTQECVRRWRAGLDNSSRFLSSI